MAFSKRALPLTLVALCLLLVPFIVAQFTTGIVWTLANFIIAGLLLLGTGLLYLLVASTARNGAYRLAAGVAVAATFLLVWGNLAVGFIGSEDNPANLLYIGVLAVGFVGAVVAQLQPMGMAKAMFAAALTQFAVPFVALSIWRPELTLGVLWVIVLNTVFAGIWVVSGWLFRRAGAIGTSPKY